MFSIDSSPEGLEVKIDSVPKSVTPATAVPTYNTRLQTVAIVPSPSGSGTPVPYVVSFAQTANGPHRVFYNEPVDTTGAIVSISNGSTIRHASQRDGASGIRRLAQTFVHRARYDETKIVVHFDPARVDANRTVSAIERSHGGVRAVTYAQSTSDITRIVTLASGTTPDEAMRTLSAEAGVTSVDRVRLRYPLASLSTGPVYPNDPFYQSGAQWYLDAIDAIDAWGYGRGNASVAIAVIDTGYDPHQTEVAPEVRYSERIVDGTIETGTTVMTDTDGHGTFVSGIAGAHTNNLAGVVGMSFGSSLQEYKVYTDGTSPVADSSDVAEAIREAVAHGAKIIVAAIGGESSAGPDPLERDAVKYAIQSGVTVVAGAGNDGNTTLDYPAAYDGVIAVGASAVNDEKTPGTITGFGNFEYVPAYSNGGALVSLVAPGGDPSGASDVDGIHWIANSYTTQPFKGNAACAAGTVPAACAILSSGTSASAAEVAGTIALMLSRKSTLTPAQIAQLLYATADDIADPKEGHGRLNAHAALAVLQGDTAPMPPLHAPTYQHFIAFAYSNAGATTPHILDVTYPHGVPVSSTGTFRIADTPVAANGTYKIAVWDDANADGIVDAGDSFGVVSSTCSSTRACDGAKYINVTPVAKGFRLP